MYTRRKSKWSKIAMLVSIILHTVAFIAFAFVKFYTDEEVGGAEVGVSFVDQQQTRVLKRSLDVRPTASLERSTKNAPTGQKIDDTRLTYRSSSDFYVDDAPKVFSEVRSVANRALQANSIKKPTVDIRRGLTREMATDVREATSRSSQPQIGVSGGAQIFGGSASMALAKPEVRVATDVKNILQTFLNNVRNKIELNKKYPVTARDAGIEGVARVRMTITKDGLLQKVEILDSSGHEILDNAALQSVRAATPFPPIPKEVKRERIEMSIDLVFKIT